MAVMGDVEHAAVLDRGPLPHPDPVVVTAEHGLGPDRRSGPDHDPADDGGIGMHEGGRVDAGLVAAEGIDGHRVTVAARSGPPPAGTDR